MLCVILLEYIELISVYPYLSVMDRWGILFYSLKLSERLTRALSFPQIRKYTEKHKKTPQNVPKCVLEGVLIYCNTTLSLHYHDTFTLLFPCFIRVLGGFLVHLHRLKPKRL